MAVDIPPNSKSDAGQLLQEAGEDGWQYSRWRLSAASREKMQVAWPELDLPWVDLAAKEFEAAWSRKASNKEGFVGWREDIESLSSASAKLLKILQASATTARLSLGKLESAKGEVALYDQAVETVGALAAETDNLKRLTADVDARSLPHPMPDLIIKLARQLRYARQPWDKKFKPQLTRLTTLTLDGLELRHAIDVRSAVKDALNSGDLRLEKLR